MEPAAAALVAGADGVELLVYFAGVEAAVALQAARMPGDPAPLERWSALRASVAAPPRPGRARIRLSARPTDLGQLARARQLAARGPAPRPAARGRPAGRRPRRLLSALARAAAALGALFAAERAPDAAPIPLDVFGAPPDALPLMRELKARFDPGRVLAPGRFAGGI